MVDKIFEIRIVDVKNVSDSAAKQVRQKVNEEKKIKPSFDYKGYAKVTYATASPPKVINIEPIEGTPMSYYKQFEKDIGGISGIF
ncbi:hypothetical protein J4207_00980 [Candidatus Woesearchaeota archaeon]|nr:hypothetical protein [Candidatus Woesearchaeota archaeon]